MSPFDYINYLNYNRSVMKVNLILAIAIALAIAITIPAHAQDELPGSQLTINAPSGFTCGRASYPENCWGIPSSVGGEDGLPGKFWLNVYYNAYPSPTGFISFNNVADLGQASVTGATVTRGTFQHGLQSYSVVTAMDVTFSGNTNDGDTYTGTGHFTFSYYWGSCSGRGCGVPLVQVIQSGSLTITYN